MKPPRRYKKLNLNRPWKEIVHEIIFEADTYWGKFFDVVLLWAILLSVVAVMLESVVEIKLKYGTFLVFFEWFVTILFTIEYILRVYITHQPKKYVISFFGIVDLLSVLPTYLEIFISGPHFLMSIRVLRLLRVFRVLKLVRFSAEAEILVSAIYHSRRKIIVFLGGVISMVIIAGTLMYIIESPESGFTSIPRSIYWAIVTLTTVGYGDIAPVTILGQFLAATLMILGYGVIAVPTGIVSVEYATAKKNYLFPEKVKKDQSSGFYCNPKPFEGFNLKSTLK